MKFEYKMLERVYPVSESELDALGSLGWELVGMVSHEYSKRVDIAISTNAIKGQLGGEENEVKAIMWVKMSDLDNYQWAFNHKHLIEGVFHTYVDYEEIEDLDNLFAE